MTTKDKFIRIESFKKFIDHMNKELCLCQDDFSDVDFFLMLKSLGSRIEETKNTLKSTNYRVEEIS